MEPRPGKRRVCPSNPSQRVFTSMLLDELAEIGAPKDQITQLNDSSLLIHFPAIKGCEEAPHIAFAAHVDTYFGCLGNANPVIHEYNGGDIELPEDGTIIPASDLKGLEGGRIISSSGSTLLGADNKAGVAALMSLIENIVHGLKHGPLTIWMCTDEEIGQIGVKFLPKGTAEGWDFFWTVDGEHLNIVDVGCFYGARFKVEFRGNDAHPGVLGHSIKPAHYATARFIDRLGDGPSPWTTKDEESFIYVPVMPECTAGKSTLCVYPRTFRQEEFNDIGTTIGRVAKEAAERYGVTATVGKAEMLYVSIEAAINANKHLLQPGIDALREFGIEPELRRIRAGTDGAMLNMTYPHIPAPNLGTGARNLHGVREFLVVEEFELVPNVLRDMVERYSNMKK